jgi:hypothetical protein
MQPILKIREKFKSIKSYKACLNLVAVLISSQNDFRQNNFRQNDFRQNDFRQNDFRQNDIRQNVCRRKDTLPKGAENMVNLAKISTLLNINLEMGLFLRGQKGDQIRRKFAIWATF